MTKASNGLRSFYRPHARVRWDGTVTDSLGVITSPESKTKQEFKAECDINNIVKHFKPHELQRMVQANAAMGMYVDMPDDLDYQAALNTVMDAEKRFMTLPSLVRDQFGQDPSRFLQFATNPANIDKMREMGLANPKPQTQAPPSAPPPEVVPAKA